MCNTTGHQWKNEKKTRGDIHVLYIYKEIEKNIAVLFTFLVGLAQACTK